MCTSVYDPTFSSLVFISQENTTSLRTDLKSLNTSIYYGNASLRNCYHYGIGNLNSNFGSGCLCWHNAIDVGLESIPLCFAFSAETLRKNFVVTLPCITNTNMKPNHTYVTYCLFYFALLQLPSVRGCVAPRTALNVDPTFLCKCNRFSSFWRRVGVIYPAVIRFSPRLDVLSIDHMFTYRVIH